ncbi:hypothetical protein ACQR09_09440 [Bradyrhizobium oligotrophicum]|uniref:hypothetical protein n=1 Tax=Bradyrhizobium oligotrophicum TaxID=44255 RepID=UPI003EC0A4E9
MTASTVQLRQMLRLRERRERHARAELEHCAARQAAANAAAKLVASTLSAQMALRDRCEAQIYHEMLGHTLTSRDIDGIASRRATLKAQLARAKADADAANRSAASARGALDEARRGFGKRLQARRKWELLVTVSERADRRREAIVEELAAADLRLGRAAP